MSDLPTIYRHQMIRCVLGSSLATLPKDANTTILNSMAHRLAENEMAMELLRAKGYGQRGASIVDMVKALPPAPQAGPAVHDIWSAR